MADHRMPSFEISPEMCAFAEQSVAQARKAFDGFVAAAQDAVATLDDRAAAAQAGAKEMQRKAVGFAEQNIAASFELAQKLMTAKDAAEMAKLHADFVKAQIPTLGEQVLSLARLQPGPPAGQPRTEIPRMRRRTGVSVTFLCTARYFIAPQQRQCYVARIPLRQASVALSNT